MSRYHFITICCNCVDGVDRVLTRTPKASFRCTSKTSDLNYMVFLSCFVLVTPSVRRKLERFAVLHHFTPRVHLRESIIHCSFSHTRFLINIKYKHFVSKYRYEFLSVDLQLFFLFLFNKDTTLNRVSSIFSRKYAEINSRFDAYSRVSTRVTTRERSVISHPFLRGCIAHAIRQIALG